MEVDQTPHLNCRSNRDYILYKLSLELVLTFCFAQVHFVQVFAWTSSLAKRIQKLKAQFFADFNILPVLRSFIFKIKFAFIT